MNLENYFEDTQGYGILSTADGSGRVNATVYARPHIVDETTVAFIMLERLTHANLKENPHAVYLFMEKSSPYQGKRLYLWKIREEENDDMVQQICRRCDYSSHEKQLTRHIVYFTVEKVLPLIGAA